jgi:hypothetical protein
MASNSFLSVPIDYQLTLFAKVSLNSGSSVRRLFFCNASMVVGAQANKIVACRLFRLFRVVFARQQICTVRFVRSFGAIPTVFLVESRKEFARRPLQEEIPGSANTCATFALQHPRFLSGEASGLDSIRVA